MAARAALRALPAMLSASVVLSLVLLAAPSWSSFLPLAGDEGRLDAVVLDGAALPVLVGPVWATLGSTLRLCEIRSEEHTSELQSDRKSVV